MKNFEQQKETYNERIQRFVGYLKGINPKWIEKRSWFDDLRKFELGEEFFDKVFYDSDGSPEDKNNFYTGILVYAEINLKNALHLEPMEEPKESGFTIEPEINNHNEREEHESLLGYLWWITIYNLASRAKQFDKDQKLDLEYKRKEFVRRIKTIESLSH